MTTATRLDEIEDGIYRISTAIPPSEMPGGFTFDQFLIADEQPLLHHAGPRRLSPAVRRALETVLPVASLRHLSFSHFEAEECGALNEFRAVAPRAARVLRPRGRHGRADDPGLHARLVLARGRGAAPRRPRRAAGERVGARARHGPAPGSPRHPDDGVADLPTKSARSLPEGSSRAGATPAGTPRPPAGAAGSSTAADAAGPWPAS